MKLGCTPAMCRCAYSHTEWQAHVIDLMHTLGWDHLHVRRTIGRGHKWVTATNVTGWPDVFGWHPRFGFAAVELKVGGDKPTAEQTAVLASLARAGASTLVAYPHDVDRLIELLRTPSPARLPVTTNP